MIELIKISKQNDKNVVSARDLHNFLEVKTDFTDWCKRMFDYGFEDGIDYSLLKIGERSAHNKTDYALTLDCAKEISMIQRTNKGKQARKYFIECERVAKVIQLALPQTYIEALRALADKTESEEKAVVALQQANDVIEENKPKVVFANSVTGSNNSVLIRQFAKALSDDGFEIGQNRIFELLREKGYLSRNNEPYQNYVAQGLFEVITRVIGDSDRTFTTQTTKITGKGQVYFAKKIKEYYLKHD